MQKTRTFARSGFTLRALSSRNTASALANPTALFAYFKIHLTDLVFTHCMHLLPAYFKQRTHRGQLIRIFLFAGAGFCATFSFAP